MSIDPKSDSKSAHRNPQSAIRNLKSALEAYELRNSESKGSKARAIFMDRDGTLNQDVGYIYMPDMMFLYPWAAEAVRLINESDFKAIVVTNQSGIARGIYSEGVLREIHWRMVHEFAREGARIDAVYYCPHHPGAASARYGIACGCRKPRDGMLQTAAREHNIDLSRSFVIGDKASDIVLAQSVGAGGVLVLTGYGRETLDRPDRWPCKPAFVAENVLEAVKRILDIESSQS